MSSVTWTSIPNSLTAVILNVGVIAVPFSQTPSSLESMNTLSVSDTFAGFATRITWSVWFDALIATAATFMSGLETVIVQSSPLRCIRNVPASSSSSLHSNPLESVAITSAPAAPEIPSPQATPEPLTGESLSHTAPWTMFESTKNRSVSVNSEALLTSIPAVNVLLDVPAKLDAVTWNTRFSGILKANEPFWSEIDSRIIIPERASTLTLLAASLISSGTSEGSLN